MSLFATATDVFAGFTGDVKNMAHDNWQQVKEIFADALRQKPEMRSEFLDSACRDDKNLRREVESLLTSFDSAESFMETFAVGEVAAGFADSKIFQEGVRFNHYEIIKQIGAGGMGEVYLANDKKLDRKVAVKILNEKYSRHEANLQRFMREAKAASSFNHPNILVIHEMGETAKAHYIVSEFVAGKTLREIFNEKSLELNEILGISIQVADALSAAHEARLIHRDIKPENIMIRPDGLVKILDFGLAKLIIPTAFGFEESIVKQNDTAKGVIMGTVNYMSPEQAKGEKVDERTDIFSLGVVIYEMITGRTPFAGDSMSETFANLIKTEPLSLSRYTANVPDELQRVAAKMLRKNRDERYQTMKDLLTDLKDLRENSVLGIRREKPYTSSKMTIAASRYEANSTVENNFVTENNKTKRVMREGKSEKSPLIWMISALILIGFVMIAAEFLSVFFGAKSDSTPNFERMNQTRLTQSGDVYAPTVSPNGQYLAFVKIEGRNLSLQLRQIAAERILELLPPRPDVKFWALAFSPDSNYLYYVEAGENPLGILYRIPLFGGQPQKIADFVSGNVTVAPNGMKLAFKRINIREGVTSIITINNDGSDARTIAVIDADSEYLSLDWSPDGSTIVYVVKDHKPDNTSWYIAEIPADGGAEHRIGESRDTKVIAARWLPDKKGLILNEVDAKTKLPQIYYLSYPEGKERRITNDLNDYYGLTITADGKSIVSQKTEQNHQIWIVPDGDASRAKQLTFKKDQHFEMASWLTDDTLVFDVDESGNYDSNNIWLMNIGDNEAQPVTTGADNNTFPVASPDGKTIAFLSSRSGKPEIWRMNSDGTQPTQLTDLGYEFFTLQFSPDGQTIYFKCSIGGKGRLMRVSVNGGEAVSISDADIYRWAISPDGKQLAYSSHDSDTQKGMTRIRPIDEDRTEKVFDIQPETYLQWSKDGQSLYFTLAADVGKNIWRQSISEKKPRRITNLDNEKVFRFASSPDGKNLAVIRYSTTYDAVLLKFGK